MNFNFSEALAALGPDAAVRIANAARPPANYLFNTFLPERNKTSYQVDAANMIVRSTMAGLVGMDSPYPPGGTVEISSFLENTAKIAITNTLPEQAMRELQQLMLQFQVNGTLTNDYLQREALNFLQKVVIQSLLDTSEWLRGQALVYGALNWSFNQKTLAVDYSIPTANKLTVRTDANNDAYGDTSSKFWVDIAKAREMLRYNVRAWVLNSVTAQQILNNSVNNIGVISQSNNTLSIRRYVPLAGNTVPDPDTRFAVDFVIYDEESEVYDLANPGKTKIVKMMPDGKILAVGQNTESGYRPGQGSTDDPKTGMELGYSHVAPTVEGGGMPGRWSRLYTPEGRPMHLTGDGVMNFLPVITAPQKLVVLTTEIL